MMRCLIIDDEPAARDVLRTYINDVSELTLIGECKNALEARSFLKEHEIDLIFLDINMPRLTGIEFLKTLTNPPKVILSTAYSEYALDGYELDVIDYLLKPFSFERFLKAVEKAERVISDPAQHESAISIKADGKIYRMPFEEILFAESQGDYITVHTIDNKITFYQTMKDFCGQLPEHQFIRIHRSYLISLSHIDYVEGNTVKIGETIIPVGKSYKDDFLKKYTT
ncbi:LytR/AlgR family response regulator transcription factor [Gracilimonas sp.]|uniref:LytR/AlgR family response regulator transcription factor n=1 Tax=Gracilimonas sp. TaxID=1974203 RepID=UPI002871757C|nr:LytTR family DNA-binding domain-containing protein [Gracilimonas sp.]